MNLRGKDVAEADTVPDPHPCSKSVLDFFDDPDSPDPGLFGAIELLPAACLPP